MIDKQTAFERLNLLQGGSLASVLRDELERLIVNGEIAPAERLNESELAERFNTSRGPVREACRLLAASGLVRVIPNRGVRVLSVSQDEAADIYDMRAALFGEAAYIYATRISDDQIVEMKSLIIRMDKCASIDGFEMYYTLNLQFHESIVSGCGNTFISETYSDLVRKLNLFRKRGLLDGTSIQESNREHRLIFLAMQSRNDEAAKKNAWQHVKSAKIRMMKASSDE